MHQHSKKRTTMFFLQKSLCFIICLLWFSLGFAGINNPLIINFSKTQYGAANKNWSISEDEHGILYLAMTSDCSNLTVSNGN